MKYIILPLVIFFAVYHLIYKYTGYSADDLLPAKPVSVRSLTAQEKAGFKPPIPIEDSVYKNTPKSVSAWAKPLYADKKTIVFINWSHRHDALLKDFKNLFRSKGYQASYRKQLYILGGSWTSWKKGSAKELLVQNCHEAAVCIVNPRTRQVAVLPKADTAYLAYFMEKYKDW